jgi:hypothetical protein
MSEETAGFGEESNVNENKSSESESTEVTLMDLMGAQGELRVKLIVAGMPNDDATGKLAASVFQDFIDGPLSSKEAKAVMANATMADS